jgi:putative ABC transport system ATP-binding protein
MRLTVQEKLDQGSSILPDGRSKGMNIDTPIIEFSNVTYAFPYAKNLFRDLSLKIMAGGFYLIRGPSGSGKSTFLRLINRLEEPLDGHLQFEGRRLTSYNPALLRRSILYIQQTPTSVDMTVRQNLLLAFSLKNNRNLTAPDDEVLRTHLDKFLLNDIDMDAVAQTLSVGQLQRLCFIRGLLLSPKVLLLDEPASALDKESGQIVEETAERLCREFGLTILMVSHRRFEPEKVKCRVLEIFNGHIEEVS